MADASLCYGIPDISLPRLDGGSINPSQLVGHELVVFFGPAGAAAAEREIADYRARLPELEKAGAWLIGVLTGEVTGPPEEDAGAPHLPLAHDVQGQGWAAFESLLAPDQRSEESTGGTFLFARGGCLARAWRGSGHAADVLRELRQRP
jgi:peroxiredoxin